MNKTKYKYLYDNVWGSIEISPLSQCFIDTYEFQRMRNIKQLGSSYFVFTCAEHNRFSHSIGVGHLARTVALHLQKLYPELVSNRLVDLLQIAGLCHDLGHGPFSHCFDEIMKKEYPYNPLAQHENRSKAILEFMVEKYKIQITPEEVQFICNTFDPTPEQKEQWKFQIISSEIDVDRMDYIIRDSKNVGVQTFLTQFQVYRIIRNMRIVNNKLKIKESVNSETRDLINSRTYMYEKIYHHKVSRAIDNMLNIIYKNYPNIMDCINSKSIKEFLKLDDSIISKIYWDENTPPEIKSIIDKIYQRDYKDFY